MRGCVRNEPPLLRQPGEQSAQFRTESVACVSEPSNMVHGMNRRPPMPTIKEAVHTAIDQDVFLQEGFARDILNKRAVARWLMKHRGIEGSFETAYDAVEEYEPDPELQQQLPWTATEELRLNQTKDVHALLLKRTPESFRQLADLFEGDAFAYQETYRIIPSRGRVLVMVEPRARDAVVEAIGAPLISKEVRDLFEISIKHRTASSVGAEAVASIVFALRGYGIEVPFVASGATEHFIVVPKAQEEQAMDIVAVLLADPEA